MRKLGLALAALAALAGCGKAKEGDPCSDPMCSDEHTALFCDDGHYQQVSCKGPQGCKARSDTQNWIICDVSGDQEGDACPRSYKGAVICRSTTHALVCNGALFVDHDCATSACQDGPADQGGSCD